MAHRRSILLINKRFQLRFAGYVCSWLLALSMIYPFLIYEVFEKLLARAAQDPYGPVISSLLDRRHEVIWLLVFLQVLFLFVTFWISIFMSHRIAGPVYKLKKTFESIRDGTYDIDSELRFRKKDHFKDLAVSFNEMMAKIRPDIAAAYKRTADPESD